MRMFCLFSIFLHQLGDYKLTAIRFATWCGPCKAIAPKIVEYVPPMFPNNSQRYRPKANSHHRFSDTHTSAHFVKIDVDEVPDVAQELGVRAMPTFMIFKDGVKFSEVVGANPEALQAAIEDAVKEE